MEFDFILLFASHYSMRDDSGDRQEGITANYLIRDNLNSEVDSATGAFGYRVSKGQIPLECLNKITAAPAIYHGRFTMKTGSDGKPVLAIQDLNFKSLITVVPDKPGDTVSDKKKGA